jgi:HEAT repeat protein
MTGQQLDLFTADCISVDAEMSRAALPINPAALSDAALIAALPGAGLATASGLAAEAGRRRLAGAVPALEGLCRRLTGFGADRLIPEQAAALEALAKIGDRAARQAVARLIAHHTVQGPTLVLALSAAAGLRSLIPPSHLGKLLKNADAAVRAGACRCARSAGSYLALLIELLDDLHREVAIAAAIALGRLGRVEARPLLLDLLRRQPSVEVVAALAPIADEEVAVTLGRVARAMPDLAQPVLDALDEVGDCRAAGRVGEMLRTHYPARNGFA